jgi:cobalamin synthase
VEFISENLGTIVVAAALIVIVAAIVINIVRKQRAGGCTGDCANCGGKDGAAKEHSCGR